MFDPPEINGVSVKNISTFAIAIFLHMCRTEHDDEPEKFTKPQKFAVVILCINQFMFTCAISLIAPIYPRELSERGGDELIAGIVLSFASFLLFCFAPVFGKLVSNYGVEMTHLHLMGIPSIWNRIASSYFSYSSKQSFIISGSDRS